MAENGNYMKSVYLKTNWIDNRTPVNASNLNNIERGIDTLFKNAISPSELTAVEGGGINIEQDENGSAFSVDDTVVRSTSILGIEYVEGELASYEPGYMYFVLSPETKKLTKIVLDNRVIYAVE